MSAKGKGLGMASLDLWGEQDDQQELPLNVPIAMPTPPDRKEPGRFTDLELMEAEPKPTESMPHGSPLHKLHLAYWRLWCDLYQIDSKMARGYRAATAPDHAALARLVNAILFGTESDRPEINPVRAPRIERAQSYLAKYLAHVNTHVKWEAVGLGDLP